MSRSSTAFPTTRIDSWADLTKLIEHFSSFSAHDWLFRGVTEEGHGLVAKIGRPTTRATKGGKQLPYKLADEKALISMFKSQALSHVGQQTNTTLEWLALAQHFGMPTRLLDWTESLLVAAWFAVEKAGAKSSQTDSAIWVARGIPAIDTDQALDPLKIESACIYRPAHVSPRIAAQASVLMICPDPTTEVALPFARKITIAKAAEFTIKKRLNACGVNRRQLFPDLQGLAEHLGWLYKHDYLAGHRPGTQARIRATPDEEDA
jgi:hypothetical protein